MLPSSSSSRNPPSEVPDPGTRPGTPPGPHLGPVIEDDHRERDRFDPPELGTVLSHYDLGVIRRIREFRRGSRRSPKVRITCERGEFLLKRRAAGHEDPQRVAFAQDLQLRLGSAGYPVPALLPTRTKNNPMLRLGARIYEMFAFIEGERDDRSPTAARQAGAALGRLHHLLDDHEPRTAISGGTYHAAAGFDATLRKIPDMVIAVGPRHTRANVEKSCAYLRESYHLAAERAENAGLRAWPRRVIHGDWHPGNLLFRDGEVVAVLDFDSAHQEAHFIDVANAALQFSMMMTEPTDPRRWPKGLDVKRMRALLEGYDDGSERPISGAELQALPWLIVEAMILESVVPIAATGRFGPLDGGAMLEMVERKVRWLRNRAKRVTEYVAEKA